MYFLQYKKIIKLKKKVLIFGAAGYIGSILSEYLLSKKYIVISADNLIYKNFFSIKNLKVNRNFKFINNQKLSNKKLEKILSEVDYVVYLAGLVGDPITKKYPRQSCYHNYKYIVKIINLLKKNLNLQKFIFISTCSNYGLINKNILATEKQKLKPLSLYAKQKVKIEKKLLLKKNKNVNPIILRFATAFGLSKRMRFDLTVNQFVKDLYLKKKLLVYDPNTWRPYCHVKDFCRLILIVIKSKNKKIIGQVFNSGGNKNNFTKIGIVNLIKQRIKKTNITYKKFDVDPRNYKVDFTKVYKILKFKPKYSVKYGIDEVLNALKKNKIKNINSKNIFGNYKI